MSLPNKVILHKDNTELAYLAGILDSEGSIMIRKSVKHDCINPRYNPRISIKMTDQRPLLMFKERFGGLLYKAKRIYHYPRSFKSNKILYHYDAENRIAYRILLSLYRFLVVKREQALLALSIYRLKKTYRKKEQGRLYKNTFITKLEDKWLQVKILNGGVINKSNIPKE